MDARWKINSQHTLTAQFLESDTAYPLDTALEFAQPTDAFDGRAAMASYEFDSRNWFGNLQYSSQSEGFRADAGFKARVGDELVAVNAGRTWHGQDGSWWSRISLIAEYDIGHLDDGSFREKDNVFRFRLLGPMQSFFQLAYRARSEFENGVLFHLERAAIYAEMTPRSGLSLDMAFRMGDEIDYDNTRPADQKVIESGISWNMNRNLLMRVRGVFARLDTKNGDRIYDATVIDARLTWQFNVRSFLRLTVQQAETTRNQDVYIEPVESETKDAGRQLLYSYKLNPQTVLFVGYADQFVDDDSLNKLTVSDRSMFIKIGYAWNL
jgi:hypothetical protein